MPCACPAGAAPAAPATVSPATGPTDPCVPTTGARMTTTAGASRPSAGSSAASPPSTKARAVSPGGVARARSTPDPAARHHTPSPSLFMPPGSLWGGLAGLLSVTGLWDGGLSQEGARSTQWDLRQRRGCSCRLPAALWVPLEAEAQSGFEGPAEGGGCVSCSPPTVSWSVRLSGFCVCPFSALPSLSAPPLVSSSLTYWQDEAPHLPPGARSPRSAPSAAGGVARCCLACGPQSKWTDTSSPMWPWVCFRSQTLPTHRERALPCTHPRPRAAGGQGPVAWAGWLSLALAQPAVDGPTPHSHEGLGLAGSVSPSTSAMCLSLSLPCPVRLALLLVRSAFAAPALREVCCAELGAWCVGPGEAGR